MPEPITMSAGALIWEFVLKPIADSIKKEYGDETKKLLKESLNKAWDKLPFSKEEQEIIEAEIIKADSETLSNKEKFLEYLQENRTVRYITAGNYYEKIIVEGDATFGGGSIPK